MQVKGRVLTVYDKTYRYAHRYNGTVALTPAEQFSQALLYFGIAGIGCYDGDRSEDIFVPAHQIKEFRYRIEA